MQANHERTRLLLAALVEAVDVSYCGRHKVYLKCLNHTPLVLFLFLQSLFLLPIGSDDASGVAMMVVRRHDRRLLDSFAQRKSERGREGGRERETVQTMTLRMRRWRERTGCM